MMKMNDFPLIISPNLGCPLIISLDELKQGKTIPLIIAGQYSLPTIPLNSEFLGTLYLRRSNSNIDGDHKDILLSIKGEPKEIVDWNRLSEFYCIEGTRKIINSELHYKVFGEHTRYWEIKASINTDDSNAILRQVTSKYRPCLYDLVYVDSSKKWERINYHSVQFVKSFTNKFTFIHLTDLHTATRNDEILDEVVKVKNKERSREKTEKSYINFNDYFRKFINEANRMADTGELDFIVITGDLVDFAFRGWEDEVNWDENNWKTFMNILIGAGKEKERNNIGLKVAAFTSTGNHDWRLHPYDPNLSEYNRESFGLKKEELKNYKYKSFDSSEYPEDKRAKLAEEITSRAFKKINLDALSKMDKWKIKIQRILSSLIGTWFMRTIPFLSIIGLGEGKLIKSYTAYFSHLVIIGIAGGVTWGINKLINYFTRRVVDMIIDNPLHAEVSALHYYLKYINPYLDYAFQYGSHNFIVMDTGADVFIGQLLDNKKVKDLKRMSLADNILGGSPDSRAFDDEQAYYNWSQIVWLEKVLAAIPNNTNKNKSFIFLHAPPINPPDDVDLSQVQEGKLKLKDKWIPEPKEHNRIYEFFKVCVTYVKSKVCKHGDQVLKPGEGCNLTYGSVNHHLSQFFYLCLGYREGDRVKQKFSIYGAIIHYIRRFVSCFIDYRKSDLVEQKIEQKFKLVDIVFSGHAHKNIEFRLEKAEDHTIRIYHDKYSKNPYTWWGKSPVIVQTASCAIKGKFDKAPPYYRKVIIENGQVTSFKEESVV